jgi:hypothetical protein
MRATITKALLVKESEKQSNNLLADITSLAEDIHG